IKTARRADLTTGLAAYGTYTSLRSQFNTAPAAFPEESLREFGRAAADNLDVDLTRRVMERLLASDLYDPTDKLRFLADAGTRLTRARDGADAAGQTAIDALLASIRGRAPALLDQARERATADLARNAQEAASEEAAIREDTAVTIGTFLDDHPNVYATINFL